MNRKTFGRRTALLTGVAAVAAPAVVRAQGEPIKIATLTPPPRHDIQDKPALVKKSA